MNMYRHLLPLVFAALIAPAIAASEAKVKAQLLTLDSTVDSTMDRKPTIELELIDETGKPIAKSVNRTKSSAMDVSNWQLTWSNGKNKESFKVTGLKAFPSSGEVTKITAVLPSDLGNADLTKDQWHLTVVGTATKSALTYTLEDGSTHSIRRIDVDVGSLGGNEAGLIEKYQPVKPKLSIEAGEDGSLFGFSYLYVSGIDIVEDNLDLYAMHAQFEGAFTPDPEDDLTVYGRFSGDVGLFRTWGIPKNEFATGSLYFDLNSRFESDQQADNYNWSFGAGVWGFVGLKPVTLFSGQLYSILNLGREEMEEPPILTTYLGYDRIVESDHEAGIPDQGEDRIRGLVRYRTPFWRNVDLPLLPTVFDVDGVVDFSAVWDLEVNSFRPEVKTSLEFLPKSVKDDKLAFTISYVSGKISPTFVDEDAFMAGIRYGF